MPESYEHPSDDLTYRIGGRLGTRAKPSGIWFNPVLFAFALSTVSWVVLFLRQIPCRPIDDQFPNAFMRTCYSDISTLYLNRALATGAPIYGSNPLEYPPVTGAFIWLARAITKLMGGVVSPSVTPSEQIIATQLFFQVNALLLFACFIVTIWIHLQLGCKSPLGKHGHPTRVWDALLIAGSPVVMLNGLINWEMLTVMLTSLGLLIWSRKHPFIAGIIFGVAFAAKFYPILILIALTLLCVRSNRYRPLMRVWLGAIAGWLVVDLPLMLTSWTGWSWFWKMNADRGADLGSIWYVLHLMGLTAPKVSAVAFVCMAVGGIFICAITFGAPRRPRLAQVAALLMLCFLIFNKVYSPQYSLWLLPILVLARPKKTDLAIWTLTESLYYGAIWAFLYGKIGVGSQWEWIYWLSVVIRLIGQLWIAVRIIDDIRLPWSDPVREPMIDDPIGGVLDHAPDARWLVALQDRAARTGQVSHKGAAGPAHEDEPKQTTDPADETTLSDQYSPQRKSAENSHTPAGRQ